MQVGVMVTNGGPHPPEKWAAHTTEKIAELIEIAPGADPQYTVAKKRFELAVLQILLPAHTDVHTTEQGHLTSKGDAHFATPIDPRAKATAAVNAIVAATKGTPFEAHFALPEVQAAIFNMIGTHMADGMHIERMWHADRNPHLVGGRAYRAKHSNPPGS